jgi:hypothetical protein
MQADSACRISEASTCPLRVYVLSKRDSLLLYQGPAESASILDMDVEQEHCSQCKRSPAEGEKPLLRCSGCLDAYFCGPECQLLGWKTHKCVVIPPVYGLFCMLI